jgi:glycosyltransferase involved in cell wall biosynthesis
MIQSRKLKVAIEACVIPGAVGGVAHATMGLIYALGRLDDGSEEYQIIVKTQEHIDWLKPHLGSNQRFVIKPESNRSKHKNVLKRGLRDLVRYIQQRLKGNEGWAELPISDGFYESLECDVVHFPTQAYTLCALPTIYNPHDLQHLHYPQFFPPQAIAWRDLIYREGCHFANTVVAASQWIKDDIAQQYGTPREKIQIIPWGTPTQAYSSPTSELLDAVKSKYHLEKPFAFYPAATWAHKNHIHLLKTLAHIRDKKGVKINLVCTGALELSLWPKIKQCVEMLKLGSQVKWLGFIPDTDLRAIYGLAQFLVMPTLFESDSFPIYEAWLEGLPVACSNVTSLPVQVLNAGEIFDPHDINSTADVILRMATDAGLREKLSRLGRERLKDFDWDRTARGYRAVYRRAAKLPLTEEDRWLLSWDWMREPDKKPIKVV